MWYTCIYTLCTPLAQGVHTHWLYLCRVFLFLTWGGKQTFLRNATVRPSRKTLSRKRHICEVSRNCVGRGLLVAVTGSTCTWQLRGFTGLFWCSRYSLWMRDLSAEQTMQHVLRCPLLGNECSLEDLATANEKALHCARAWPNIPGMMGTNKEDGAITGSTWRSLEGCHVHPVTDT